jgi:hypothetical protein
MAELKEIPRIPDFEEFLDEEKKYYIEQLEALEEIGKLEGDAGEHAHYLLTLKNPETFEFMYKPSDVLGFVKEPKD